MTGEPFTALLRHLEQAPSCPVPEALRAVLVTELRRSRAERDRLLNAAAEVLDPRGEMGRWVRAKRLAELVQRFNRPENGARRGRRAPTNEVERLLIEADRCGCGLPASPRRVWDALRPVDDAVSRSEWVS